MTPRNRASIRGCFNRNNARMLGKAVKIRHCPATVSAPAASAVSIYGVTVQDSQPGSLHASEPKPLKAASLWEGG